MLVCMDLKKCTLAKLSNLNKEQNIWYIKNRKPNNTNATIVFVPINKKASLKTSLTESHLLMLFSCMAVMQMLIIVNQSGLGTG